MPIKCLLFLAQGNPPLLCYFVTAGSLRAFIQAYHVGSRCFISAGPHVPVPQPPQASKARQNDYHRDERAAEVPEALRVHRVLHCERHRWLLQVRRSVPKRRLHFCVVHLFRECGARAYACETPTRRLQIFHVDLSGFYQVVASCYY